ncbi:MAG: alpha/beta hydrolase family protein [Planctomycetota bacterium]|jgi:dipeptidyl aminopeptidase/acylaminoacyl peptidase
MLYRAVKFHTNTPVRYVQYPGEGHGNRRNTNRFDYTVRTLRWFDHYLKTNDRRAALPDFHLDYSEWYQTK